MKIINSTHTFDKKSKKIMSAERKKGKEKNSDDNALLLESQLLNLKYEETLKTEQLRHWTVDHSKSGRDASPSKQIE
jgi:hypothetical protein